MFSAEVVKQISFLICSKDGTYAINVLKGRVRVQHAPNCPDWEKMLKLLEIHTVAEHGAAVGGRPPSTSKL